MIEVRLADPDDWALLREIRLAALGDSPEAFGSAYAREVEFDEATWRARLAARTTFFAWDGDRLVGLASGYRNADAPDDDRELVSMWVAPAARGRGAAGLLLDAVAGWAREQGARTLSLWVVEGNAAARSAYERAGFTLTGERQPVHPGDPRIEERMVCPL